MLRRILIDIPALIWDWFWFVYGWFIAILSAVCIMVTLGWVLLHFAGVPLP